MLLPLDWMVALLLLITAPLIPVFMALAGWGAEAASRRQADRPRSPERLLRRPAARPHDAEALRSRARRKPRRSLAASEELRVRTMRVMRIAFLSSAVLEFFAALGVAGVALYVGLTFLRLVNLRGAPLSLEAGLFCLLMAPEVYQPLRLLAAHYHDRAAAKAAVAEIADAAGEPSQSVSHRDWPCRRRDQSRGTSSLVVPSGHRRAQAARSSQCQSATSLPEHTSPSSGRAVRQVDAARGRRRAAAVHRLDPTRWPGARRAAQNLSAIQRRRARPAADHLCRQHRRQHPARPPRRLPNRRCDRGAQGRGDGFRRDLPEGLDTLLGEDGLGLSGGEMQRVALARLYLRDPGLLLLDEPTAHLDAATECAVLDGLIDFARGRTLVVVTHSAAVAARMDRCYRVARRPAAAHAASQPRDAGLAGGGMRALLLLRRCSSGCGDRCCSRCVLSLVTLAAGIGLLGISGWFLTAAALSTAGAAFNLFGPSAGVRGLSFVRILSRYGEKLTGHDATLRLSPICGAGCSRGLFRLVPLGRRFGRADLVSRLVADLDALDTLFLVALGPITTAVLAGTAMSIVVALVLPRGGDGLRDRLRDGGNCRSDSSDHRVAPTGAASREARPRCCAAPSSTASMDIRTWWCSARLTARGGGSERR